MMLNPYALLGGVLALVAAMAGSYVAGRRDGAAIVRGGELKAVVAQQQVADLKQQSVDASAQAAAAQEQGRQQGVREIDHEKETIVERPVYAARCVDADGVRLLARAADLANGQGQPGAAGAPAAPAPAAPAGGPGGHDGP